MAKNNVKWTLLLLILVAGCATTDLYDIRTPARLKPFSVPADSTAKVRYIVPGSPAASAVEVGDVVLSVDGKPVASTWDFYSAISPTASVVRVKDKQNRERDVPVSSLVRSNTYETWAWLIEPGQTLSFKLNNPAYAEEQDAALVYPGNSIALISASVWPTRPKYLEVYLELRVPPDCRDCKLENIAALDLSRNSWLSPVPSDHVAWALYQAAEIPPPSPRHRPLRR